MKDVPARRRLRGGAGALALLLIGALSFSDCGGTGVTSGPGIGGSPTPTATPAASSTPIAAAGTRDHILTRAALGPWWGSGCPRNGACGCGDAQTLAEEFTYQMDRIRENDLPISVYLFDGSSWSERDSRSDGMCTGSDCCSWKLGEDVIARLSKEHVRALVHFWGGCHGPDQYAQVHSQLGGNLLGFYLDDGSSDQELMRVNDFMRSVSPGDFENVGKSHQSREPSVTDGGLAGPANVAYVGDLTNDFAGLREGITRLLEKSRLLPAPMNEFTAYDYIGRRAPDEETFHRRLHWGAFQPVMAHTPFSNSDPWREEYGPDLLVAYRYYSWLHKELTPYFLSYARRMHEQPQSPVIQPGPGSYSMRVGDEIFVPFITAKTPTLDIQLPTGQWVDYWDDERVVSGNLIEHRSPRGQEPVFLRLGAIIPLEVERDYTGHGTRESAGSLTLLVYPSGTSSFRYNNDENGVWSTFRSVVEGERLTLSVDPAPPMPLLYRIGRVITRPTSIRVDGRTVLVNQSGSLPEMATEREVNDASTSAWFHDPIARRLIVKVVP